MKKITSVFLLVLALGVVSQAGEFDCYLAATKDVSPPSGAVTLCEGMKANTSPSECFKAGSHVVGPSVAFKICTKSVSVAGPVACFQKLQTSIGASVASTLCRGSNGDDSDERLSCWNRAQQVGSGGSYPGYTVDPGLAAKLCSN